MPDHREEEGRWYPAAGESEGRSPAEDRPGVRVELEGGPLAGRTAHLIDRDGSLWVAQSSETGMIARSGHEPPMMPPGVVLLGRYRFDPTTEVLRWES